MVFFRVLKRKCRIDLPAFRLDLASDRSGAMAVEFALIAPVLFALLLGIFQLGMIMNNWIELTNAAASAARELSVSRGSPTPYSSTVSVLESAAANLDAALLLKGVTITVGTASCNNDTSSGNRCTDGKVNGALVANAPATVIATYPCFKLRDLLISLPLNCQLSSSSTEMVQ